MGASAGGQAQRLPSGGLAGQGGSTPTGGARPDAMPASFGGRGMQPNIYQQSARSVGQAQQTMGQLARFRPQQMQAAVASPTATYGGATVERTPAYGGATVERTAGPQFAKIGDMQTYGGATIAPIERARAAQLGPAQTMQSVGAVQSAQAPSQIAVDEIRTRDISQYMSPYQQQVINPVTEAIERQRLIAQEQLEGQATKAKAFGARRDLERDRLAEASLRQTAQAVSPLYQQGFQQAQQAAQFDIGQTQAARTMASQQEFQASQLGQQAREAAAAREQAVRAGNMQAANEFAQQQAGFEQQATLANQAAFNTRAQAQAGLTQQAGLASMQAVNQRTMQQAAFEQQAAMAAAAQEAARASQQAGLTQQAGLAGAAQDAARASQQAGLTQQAGLSNQAAINQAIQAQAARQQAANQANFQGQFTGAGIRQGAASGLAGLGQQQFNMGQAIQQQQAQQGAVQRGIMQGLIGAGQQNFGQYTGAPTSGLGTLMSSLTGVPEGQTSSFQPGFLNYLQTAAMF